MLLLRLGPLLPFYFLLMGVLPGAMGWAFWTLKNWARLIVSALLVISLVGAAVEMVHGCPTSDAKGIAVALVRVAIALLIFWCLCLAPVRRVPRSSNYCTVTATLAVVRPNSFVAVKV